ncbi:MAG: nuclear transport factor 2 family protein [Acidobacteria bacterium]|nr:nuclear transport factor 2 family protein [Acidobacteriota bacterium]MCA1650366.1 nuclear transport factor 2 family protein [Acidobacteriota bacterium]
MKRVMLGMVMACALVVTSLPQAQQPDEREAVKAAVLDYVEAIYQAQPDRIQRSVHADLAKRGYYRKRGEQAFTSEPMTYQQLFDLAGRWNKDGKRPVATYPKDVVVYDVLNQTATAKLTAMWGVDYMHLAKYDGTWKIVNILWQEPPASK